MSLKREQAVKTVAAIRHAMYELDLLEAVDETLAGELWGKLRDVRRAVSKKYGVN